MADDFDAYYQWLGIPPSEQPPNHYRLLGIPLFEEDPVVIRAGAHRQMAYLRTYQLGKHSELSQDLLNEVAAAKICLLDPQKRAEYDLRLNKHVSPSPPPTSPQPPPPTPVEVNDAAPQPPDYAFEIPLDSPAVRPKSPRVRTPFVAAAVIAVVVIGILCAYQIAFRNSALTSSRPRDARTVLSPARAPQASKPPKIRTDQEPRPRLTEGTTVEPESLDLPLNEWVDVMNGADPARDALTGRWQCDGNAIRAAAGPLARMMLPLRLDGAYELELQFTRDAGNDAVVVVLPVGQTFTNLGIGGWGGNVAAVEVVDGRWEGENLSGTRCGALTNGRRYTVLVQVRTHDGRLCIDVSLDGKQLIRWAGVEASLRNKLWGLREQGRLALGANISAATFHSCRLRLLSGKGTWVQPRQMLDVEPKGKSKGSREGGDLKPPVAPQRVYLAELKPVSIAILGPNRRLADPDVARRGIHQEFAINGVKVLHGLYVHPPADDSSSIVVFNLNKAFRELSGACAIARGAPGPPVTPLRFRVFCDGRPLWELQPMQAIDASQAFRINVSGAELLEMYVDCHGSNVCLGSA